MMSKKKEPNHTIHNPQFTTRNLPKLRFPEFRNAGPWQVKRLGEVSNEIVEKVGDKKLVPVSISAGKGFVTQEEKFGRNISGRQYTNYVHLKRGQFAYNKGNSKSFPQGAIYQLREFDEAAVPNAFYSFEFKPAYIPEFFTGYFENNFHGKQLARFITSGARSDGLLNVSANDFFSILLPIPKDKEEQQKIADCLSSLDELITRETQKLDALKAHKRGLMQQLFPREGETTPRLRFPEFRNAGPWEMKRLGEVFTERIERGGSELELLSVTMADGVVRTNDLERANNASTDLSNYKRVYPGDIVYNTMRMWQGASGASQWHGIVSPAYTVVTPLLNQNPIFWAYYFKLLHSIEKFTRFSQGLTSDTWNLKYPAFSAIKMTVPTMPTEQQKIADCLTSLDELIALETQRLEALKAHKKGLMQQLFPQEVKP